MLVVKYARGRAIIGIQGAQVMSFQPSGAQEMLWVSPKCVLEPGKAVRESIPLRFPWFGPSQDGAVLHRFGRIME
jgi:D-hexose-6-phosphate mutarotase